MGECLVLSKMLGGVDCMTELKAKEYKKFEDIKHTREDGSEFWSARELSDALEYTQWRNFSKVMERAMIACENSGHDVFYDFAEVSKIVDAGVTNKPIKDYELSRYACSWMRIEDVSSFVGTSNSGISFWRKQHMMPE